MIIQIYTAFTAYCLLALSAEEVKFKGSLYDFANLVSTCLTENEWLDVIVKRHQGINNVGMFTEIPSLFDEFDYQ